MCNFFAFHYVVGSIKFIITTDIIYIIYSKVVSGDVNNKFVFFFVVFPVPTLINSLLIRGNKTTVLFMVFITYFRFKYLLFGNKITVYLICIHIIKINEAFCAIDI